MNTFADFVTQDGIPRNRMKPKNNVIAIIGRRINNPPHEIKYI